MAEDQEVEIVENTKPLPVVIDIKAGDSIAVRFSANFERKEKSGEIDFELWYWAGGVVTEQDNGVVHSITDVMNGTTRLREESSCPETIAHLIIESWLINHGRDWALAFTDGTRDLSGRALRPDEEHTEEIEACHTDSRRAVQPGL